MQDALELANLLPLKGHKRFKLKLFEGMGHGLSRHKGLSGSIPTVGPIDPEVLSYLSSYLSDW